MKGFRRSARGRGGNLVPRGAEAGGDGGVGWQSTQLGTGRPKSRPSLRLTAPLTGPAARHGPAAPAPLPHLPLRFGRIPGPDCTNMAVRGSLCGAAQRGVRRSERRTGPPGPRGAARVLSESWRGAEGRGGAEGPRPRGAAWLPIAACLYYSRASLSRSTMSHRDP